MSEQSVSLPTPAPNGSRRLRRAASLALVLVVVCASLAAAQFGRNRGGGRARASYATIEEFDGGFQFCRLVYRSTRGGYGSSWNVDWPRADENLSIRMSELTRVSVSMHGPQQPKTLLLSATAPELTHCGFVMMTEPGSSYLDEQEAEALRQYLQRGGFLWVDDFWGEYAWEWWESELRKILPSGPYPIVDLPLDHPIFHQVLPVSSIPQIPSINFFAGTGQTSERGADSAIPHVRGINDAQGRLMVLMTHNTDMGDAYERESDDPEYFERFSVAGYAFGINVIVYTMTH
jgi:hypothetical protein